MRKFLIKFIFIGIALMVFPLFSGNAFAKEQFLVGGATVGTTPYVFAVGFTTLANKYCPESKFVVQATGGSVENIKLLNQKEIDLGLITPGVLTAAKEGTRWFKNLKDSKRERYDNVRGLFVYFHGAFHFIVKDNSPIQTIFDLKGKRVALGAPGSNVALVAIDILEAHGLKKNVDYTGVELDANTASQAWQDGTVDFWCMSSEIPGGLVSNATALNKFRLIPIEDEKAIKVMRDKKVLNLEEEGTTLTAIEPGAYPTMMNKKPVNQLGILLALHAHKDTSENTVYCFIKAVLDRLDELYKNIGPTGKGVNLKNALEGIVVPLHPGAVKYYREKGMIK